MGENWSNIRFRCSTCDGTGVYHGVESPESTCPECNGDGYVDSRLQVKIKTISDMLEQIWDKVKNL